MAERIDITEIKIYNNHYTNLIKIDMNLVSGSDDMSKITLIQDQEFTNRAEISEFLGGNPQSGITMSSKTEAILLFKNEEELYSDYFYPRGTHDYCMYTGIGRKGHQDSLNNKMYDLNIAVLSHKRSHKSLLLFEKRKSKYYFVGEYELTETHQNIQPDDKNFLRRVFIFHLKKVSNTIEIELF